jgi:hypothetical protein
MIKSHPSHRSLRSEVPRFYLDEAKGKLNVHAHKKTTSRKKMLFASTI